MSLRAVIKSFSQPSGLFVKPTQSTVALLTIKTYCMKLLWFITLRLSLTAFHPPPHPPNPPSSSIFPLCNIRFKSSHLFTSVNPLTQHIHERLMGTRRAGELHFRLQQSPWTRCRNQQCGTWGCTVTPAFPHTTGLQEQGYVLHSLSGHILCRFLQGFQTRSLLFCEAGWELIADMTL